MGRRTKAGLWLVVVAGAAFGAWWIVWEHGGTAARVAHWLESAECPEVSTKTIRLPEAGPAYAGLAQRRFADQATDFKSIECGGVSGGIDVYRFSSTAARVRAVAAYPDLHLHFRFCVGGAEVLVDGLLGYRDPFVDYCHRLQFELYPPLNLYPAGPIDPNTPVYPEAPIRSTLTLTQLGGPQTAIAIAAGGKRLSAQGTIACRHPDEQVRVLALVTQAQTNARAVAKSPAHCRLAEGKKNRFASWKLTLTAFGPARFTAGKAVIAFAYYRGTPLLRFFARRGYVKLIAH